MSDLGVGQVISSESIPAPTISVGVGVMVGVGVRVGVLVGGCVGDGVRVAVRVAVGVGVRVGGFVAVGIGDGNTVGVVVSAHAARVHRRKISKRKRSVVLPIVIPMRGWAEYNIGLGKANKRFFGMDIT